MVSGADAGLSRPSVVLASRSPQRRAILEQLGIDFEVTYPDVDELNDGDPSKLVVENALRKARAAKTKRKRGSRDLILGADTEVVVDGRIFGKAAGEAEARAHLAALSGRAHEVFGGIALVDDSATRTAVATTTVTFRILDEITLEWYLATGEWRGRAGAYAIQGHGAALAESVEGDFWNVVGLPVATLLDLEPSLIG